MPAAEKATLDRRQRKSRAALHQALLSLIGDKPYGEITVDDVVTVADVARATFYAHYRDKSDLLAEATRELLADLAAELTAASWANPPRYDGTGLLTLVEHAQRHRDLYRLLVSGEGGTGPRQALVAVLREAATEILTAGLEDTDGQPRIPVPLIATSFVGALLATIEDWLNGEIDLDARELATALMRQQVDGLEWALGFEAGQMAYRGDETDADATESSAS